jgi:hypothetical protein
VRCSPCFLGDIVVASSIATGTGNVLPSRNSHSLKPIAPRCGVRLPQFHTMTGADLFSNPKSEESATDERGWTQIEIRDRVAVVLWAGFRSICVHPCSSVANTLCIHRHRLSSHGPKRPRGSGSDASWHTTSRFGISSRPLFAVIAVGRWPPRRCVPRVKRVALQASRRTTPRGRTITRRILPRWRGDRGAQVCVFF